ncbi:hypothetical protein ACFSUI_20320 [Ralstonia solanacearum]
MSNQEKPLKDGSMESKTDKPNDWSKLSPAVVEALRRGEPLYVVDALGNGVVPDSPVTVVTDKGSSNTTSRTADSTPQPWKYCSMTATPCCCDAGAPSDDPRIGLFRTLQGGSVGTRASSFSWHRGAIMRGVLLTAATATLLPLTGCGLSPADRAAASVGFGDTISEKTLNNMARPPKQVVYRFDDHRYIESDPGPGYNLPCQAELFYVDERLGIRTQFGGNGKRNPTGLFKVVNSPYVIARDDDALYVSFDQGRSFEFTVIASSADVVVVGNNIYVGSGSDGSPVGAFTGRSIRRLVIKPAEKKIELQYTAQEPLAPDDVERLARARFPVPAPDPRYAELKKPPASTWSIAGIKTRISISRAEGISSGVPPSTVNANCRSNHSKAYRPSTRARIHESPQVQALRTQGRCASGGAAKVRVQPVHARTRSPHRRPRERGQTSEPRA